MSIDPYEPCPCGGGKKIKFCCCSDITGELERIQRMLEGDQRLACLEHVERLMDDGRDRPALLALRAMLAAGLGETEKADQAVAAFVDKCPENPNALAERALRVIATDGGHEAIIPLQRAIEACTDDIPMRVYTAISEVAQALLTDGDIVAGRGHLVLAAGVSGGKDQDIVDVLMRINAAPNIPLLLKNEPSLGPCPADAPWQNEFDSALTHAARGRFQQALDAFNELAKQAPRSPVLLKNCGLLNGWLGNTAAMAAVLHKYASLDGIPHDDAVEAEAFAQLLGENPDDDAVSVSDVTLAVNDTDRLMERLLSDQRVANLTIDVAQLATEDSPPPKGVFFLLDRPMPDTGVGLALDEIPHSHGQVAVFGKQTDREAYLSFVTAESEDFAEKFQSLADIAGDALGEEQSREELETRSRVELALTANWRLPPDTPRVERDRLLAENQRRAFLEVWPDLPFADLNGNSPRAIAKDPAYQVRLAATILRFETSSVSNDDFSFDDLRQQLGLDPLPTIDPQQLDIRRVPLARLGRVESEKLTDDQLVHAFRRAAMMSARQALTNLAREVVQRDTLGDQVDRADAFGILARLATDANESLDFTLKARDSAITAGKSPARWLLEEMELRIQRDEPTEFQRILQEVESRYLNEPGIGAALMELLSKYGFVGPDGAPVGGPSEAGGEPVQAAAESAEGGTIWTPGSEAAAGGEKPGLWTPE